MRATALVLLLAAVPLQAANVDKLLRQIERGSTADRATALRELAKEDPAAATATGVAWLEPGIDPPLRRAAARTLWDLGEKAKPAEPALRARLGDPDDDVAYNCVGALAAMGVPKADLRAARLRLARSNDGFIAFYAARALHPDPDLPLDVALDSALAAMNLVAAGRPSDMRTRDALRTNARAFIGVIAEKSGREGFDAMMRAFTKGSPPSKDAIAEALDKVPPQYGDVRQIAALLDSDQRWVKRGALVALVDYRERAVPALPAMLSGLAPQEPKEIRESTARALGALGAAPGLASEQAVDSTWRRDVETRIAPALAQAATADVERDVRKEAADALQKLALWAGPALGTIGDRIPREPDPVVRHALVRACWKARESPALPRTVLASLAATDPVDYIRTEASITLQAAGR